MEEASHPPTLASFREFENLDIRAGTVVEVKDFPEARIAAWKLWIDFGPLGIKTSSARITALYDRSSLLGRQVIAVINFPPRQIGPFMSECLVLGVTGSDGSIVLLEPERQVNKGGKIS